MDFRGSVIAGTPFAWGWPEATRCQCLLALAAAEILMEKGFP